VKDVEDAGLEKSFALCRELGLTISEIKSKPRFDCNEALHEPARHQIKSEGWHRVDAHLRAALGVDEQPGEGLPARVPLADAGW